MWLFLLCREIEARPDAPEWLRDARDHWHLQATVGFAGCVSAELDRYLGQSPQRVEVLREVVIGARKRLISHSLVLPRAILNS